jgi:tetratricopeptide (TPR) repeat protein/mono/diheme cytochrome c family protein
MTKPSVSIAVEENMHTLRLGVVLVLWVSAAVFRAAPAGSAQSAAPAEPPAITFARDVAPILISHCAECHRHGGSAPFPLLTYEDVRPRARQIVSAIARRTMPPWLPDPGFGAFAGERRLTDAQIAVFTNWVAAGAPAGHLREAPSRPESTDDWLLGKPDLVVSLPQAYRLGPAGTEQLRNFVVPIPTSRRRFVKAWEFKTTNPAVVHHATMVLDPTHAARQLDERDPAPGYEGIIPLSARNPDGYFLGWTPGQRARAVDDQMAWRLDPDTDLIAMLHLRPSGQWEEVNVSLGLYFADAPPTLAPVMVRLNRQDIDIPAGQSQYTISDSYTLPVPVAVIGVQPHAHNLVRRVKGYATLPDGTTRWLLRISNWNFHWQDAYRLATPLKLPAGTRLTMEYTYDNSENNVSNPSRPPRRVTYGQRTSDEMGDLWVQVVPDDPGDAPSLRAGVERKLLFQNIIGYQMLLTRDPDNVSLRDDLGILFAQAGDLERSLQQFAESLRLRPDMPAVHYNVGNALLGLGRWEQAQRHFNAALARDPGYRLAAQGLARARLQRAWMLATSPDVSVSNPREAVTVAERAVADLGERTAAALDVLAAAYAAAGDFDKAIATIHEALNASDVRAAPAFADAVQRRLALYQQRRPYVDR